MAIASIFNLHSIFIQSSYTGQMGTVEVEPITVCHVVALPYPGRGHINPMMNLCKLLSSKNPQLLITFVVTEEWHGLIESDPKPDNIRLATIPNVIPSEHGRANHFAAFVDAVWTKLEAPVEQLMDGLQQPVTTIVADTFLVWALRIGNRRNIPVASLWTQSPMMFSLLHHFELFKENGHFPLDVSESPELPNRQPGPCRLHTPVARAEEIQNYNISY